METLKLTCLELATWTNVSIPTSCGALENRKFKNQVGKNNEGNHHLQEWQSYNDRSWTSRQAPRTWPLPFIFPALSLGQPPRYLHPFPVARIQMIMVLLSLTYVVYWDTEIYVSMIRCRACFFDARSSLLQFFESWNLVSSSRSSLAGGSSLNQINECIVPILQIWIWNIESTRSMIGLIWVDFVRLRGSFYTSGIRLHQLHLVARWITLANIAWQSCERNKSSLSQLFNWYELHWIAIFAMIYFQHRGFLGAPVNARVAYF